MNSTKRPQIKVPKNRWDYLIEILGFGAILFLVIYPSIHYSDLPQEIPIHFGADGQPDNYGSKASLFILPLIGLVLYLSIHYLNRFPHLFNYAVKITPANAFEQYQKARRLLRWVNTLVVLVFAYILFASVQTALGHQNGLGDSFLWIFIALMASPMVIYLLSLSKK